MEDIIVFAQQQFVIIIALTAVIFLLIRHEGSKGGEKLSCLQVVGAVNKDDAVIVDVRETKEFDDGHIVNAIHIPHAKIADSVKVLEKHRQKKIIVVDKMGQHSAAVVKTLEANEFTVARLSGGITEWKQDNLPLVK
ncbi:rhodanese-like domain-containing protein [Eionea flava]